MPAQEKGETIDERHEAWALALATEHARLRMLWAAYLNPPVKLD